MPSQADLKGWFKVLENRLEEKRMKKFEKVIGKEIMYFEENSYRIFISFTDGTWLNLQIERDEDDHSYHIAADKVEYNLVWNRSFFLKAGLISESESNQVWDYAQALAKFEYDERDRKEYERLKKRFEKT